LNKNSATNIVKMSADIEDALSKINVLRNILDKLEHQLRNPTQPDKDFVVDPKSCIRKSNTVESHHYYARSDFQNAACFLDSSLMVAGWDGYVRLKTGEDSISDDDSICDDNSIGEDLFNDEPMLAPFPLPDQPLPEQPLPSVLPPPPLQVMHKVL